MRTLERKISKVLSSAAIMAGLFLTNPLSALAAAGTGSPDMPTGFQLNPGKGFEQLQSITFVTLVTGAIRLILVVAALVFFFILVAGGIQWIISGGDKTGAEAARKRITNALVGLAIVFVAWAIITLIKALFGVDIFSLTIPTFQGTPIPT